MTEEQKIAFLHRSYSAVDGLWFMKLEERFGFETALAIDREVWKIMPKIQARSLKGLLNENQGLEALCLCFSHKLELDGFQFETHKAQGGKSFEIVAGRCPWFDLMVKSKREKLAPAVGQAICDTEYGVWAKEFGDNIAVKIGERICNGAANCRISFSLCEEKDENNHLG